MGRDDIADPLTQTLENEKATDVALTQITVGAVNVKNNCERNSN